MKAQKKKRNNATAVNSALIRRPIQRCFAIFLLPTFVCFCIGFLFPFVYGIILSFCKFTTIFDGQWIGLSNYVRAFQDASFINAFGYTTLIALTSLVFINVLAFAVAYALTRGIKGSNLFRGVFFLPNLIGGIVLGYIWTMIFNGLFPVSVKVNANYGYWGLMIMLCWQQVGYMMIIYIAGLQSVSEDMIEAARIDGANGWHILWNITIPTVMPSITICTFLTLTNGYKLFDQNMVLTGGAPMVFRPDGNFIKSTQMLALNIYESFNLSNARGVAQAKAVVFFILVAAIALVQLRATRTKEVQQ